MRHSVTTDKYARHSQTNGEYLAPENSKDYRRKTNPMVASHGGRIDRGLCQQNGIHTYVGWVSGCSSSKLTLKEGVERELFAALPRIQQVVDVTDHEAGENPYYA